MLERHLHAVLRRRAEKMPVVTLTGPRQSGKTTLATTSFPDHAYVSLERPDERLAAERDPLGFLARFPDGVIIDEVQRVPALLSYIQVDVDQEDRPGRFILTGSQNLLLMESVSQTLAGRTAILHLLPFSLTELWQRSPLDFRQPRSEPMSGSTLWQTVWTGLYPRIHDRGLEPQPWLADYQRTYVERDLRQVAKVRDLDAFERFIRLVAAQTGQELNLSSLAADGGISQPTAKAWLTALRVSWIVTLLPPHHRNYRKRLRKRPKLHFLDTGLACYLLGITSPSFLERHPLRGAIFESFVVSEIYKSFSHRGLDPPLFHWRDATGHEVDLIIDQGESLIPVEVKSGQTVVHETLEGLAWWRRLAGQEAGTGILVHGGDRVFTQEGLLVRPWWLG